jgi:hypothetical protein
VAFGINVGAAPWLTGAPFAGRQLLFSSAPLPFWGVKLGSVSLYFKTFIEVTTQCNKIATERNLDLVQFLLCALCGE